MAASLVSILYPILQFVLPPRTGELDADTVVAAKVNELALNASKIFRFGNRPGLLVRSSDGSYRAFTGSGQLRFALTGRAGLHVGYAYYLQNTGLGVELL